MPVLGIYLIVGLLAVGGFFGWGEWRHHSGYVEGQTDERVKWEAESAKNKAMTDAAKTAVAEQAQRDADAVAAKLGPLAAIIRNGSAKASMPPKVEVVFDPKCKVSAQVVEASNVGR